MSSRCPEVDLGRTTIHELRQEQLPAPELVTAVSHVQLHERHPLRVPRDRMPALV